MSESHAHGAAPEDGIDAAQVDAFIDRWEKSGGSELANFQMFAGELCVLLGLPKPDPSEERNEYNDYAFERRIDFKHDDGSTSPGRIDLYRRGCFVMEAKQSAKRVKARTADPRQPHLLPEDAMQVRAAAPASAEILSAAFRGRDSARRRKSVEKALETLAAAGAAQRTADGHDDDSRYFIPR